jgi:hypothetical protein
MKYYYNRYWGSFTNANPLVESTNYSAELVGYGYSGQPSFLNDIHKENLKNIGPLPAGMYTITSVYNDSKRVNHTCVLTPMPCTKLYDRYGFLIHGDTATESHDASDGCIVTPLWVRQLFKTGDVIEVL